MINVDLQQLVQALDAASKHDLECAAERCVVRGGSKILVEDLLLGLLERPEGFAAPRTAGCRSGRRRAGPRPTTAWRTQ